MKFGPYRAVQAIGGHSHHAIECNTDGQITSKTALCGQTALQRNSHKTVWYGVLKVSCPKCMAVIIEKGWEHK